MKLLLLLLAPLLLSAAEPKKGFERAIMEYKQDACSAAKAQARAGYDLLHLDPGCFCEKTDDHLWLCDVRFTYTARRPAPKSE